MRAFKIRVRNWLAPSDDDARIREQALPASIRRRVTPLGRRALGAAWSLEPGPETRFVFASRHGEYSRTFAMLRSLSQEGTVSPADFSMSVHHALAGLLSIATGSQQGHSALAAGRDTFGYSLVEAAACLAETPERPVLAVYYDEPLPDRYPGDDSSAAGPVVVAMMLESPRGSGDIEISADPCRCGPRGDLASAFIAFMESDDIEGEAYGERLRWRWRHA